MATHHVENLGDGVLVTSNLTGVSQSELLGKMLNTCTFFDPTSGVALIIAGIHCQSRLWIWGFAIDPQFGQSFRVQPEIMRRLALKPHQAVGHDGVQDFFFGAFATFDKHCRRPATQPQPPLFRVLLCISFDGRQQSLLGLARDLAKVLNVDITRMSVAVD